MWLARSSGRPTRPIGWNALKPSVRVCSTLSGSMNALKSGVTVTAGDLYDPVDYTAGQVFGEAVRSSGDGITYDSVRHVDGVNVVAYRPRKIRNILQCEHYELTVPLTGKIVARRLAG